MNSDNDSLGNDSSDNDLTTLSTLSHDKQNY